MINYSLKLLKMKKLKLSISVLENRDAAFGGSRDIPLAAGTCTCTCTCCKSNEEK
jgi:hypothetical protein